MPEVASEELQTRLAAALLVYLESQRPEPTPEERRAEIRRWYAVHALQGAMASFAGSNDWVSPDRFAQIAFETADAMLKAEGL